MNGQQETQMNGNKNIIILHDNKTKKDHRKWRWDEPLQTGPTLYPTEIQIKIFEYLEKPDVICYGVFLGNNSGMDFQKITPWALGYSFNEGTEQETTMAFVGCRY